MWPLSLNRMTFPALPRISEFPVLPRELVATGEGCSPSSEKLGRVWDAVSRIRHQRAKETQKSTKGACGYWGSRMGCWRRLRKFGLTEALGTQRTSIGVGTNRFLLSLWPGCTLFLLLELWALPVFARRSWENFGLYFYGINFPTVNTTHHPINPAQHWSRGQGWGEGCASGPEKGARLGWAVASLTWSFVWQQGKRWWVCNK